MASEDFLIDYAKIELCVTVDTYSSKTLIESLVGNLFEKSGLVTNDRDNAVTSSVSSITDSVVRSTIEYKGEYGSLFLFEFVKTLEHTLDRLKANKFANINEASGSIYYGSKSHLEWRRATL